MKKKGGKYSRSKLKLIKKNKRLREALLVLSKESDLHEKVDKSQQLVANFYAFKLLIENVLSNLHIYLNVIDSEGNITYSYGSGLLTLGLSNHQLVGSNIYDKYPHLTKYFRSAHKGKMISFNNAGKENGERWKFNNWLIPVFDKEYKIVNLGISTRYQINKKTVNQKAKSVGKLKEEVENEMAEQVKKVAHDLRSPLNSILALLEIIELKPDKSDLSEEFAMTRGVIQRMKSLIINLLNHNQHSNPLLDKVNVDCQELLEDIKTDLLSIMGRAEITIVNKNLPIIVANPTQLHQLFLNLIDNAVKYNSNKKPKVWINMKSLKKEWQFSVRDNGIGISKKHLSAVFENKKRVAKKKRVKGSGIGLATCKSIVENHNGKIWVKSKLDKGSTFFFTLAKFQQ